MRAMHEILFRGKDLANEWQYGNLAHFFNPDDGKEKFSIQTDTPRGSSGEYVTHNVAPDTVGQWIGLYDRKGKPIFEGDILKTDYSDEEGPLFAYEQVKWDKDNARWAVYGRDDEYGTAYDEIKQDFPEVVGNIIDTPELLELNETEE